MKTFLIAAAAAAGAAVASPALAVTTTLDFNGNICSANSCDDYDPIDQSYGDGVGVDVAYASYTDPAGTPFEGFLKYWDDNYGDLQGIVWGGGGQSGYRSEITFTALAGYEISLVSFDVATYQNRSATSPFTIANLGGGTTILDEDVDTNWPTHTHVSLNSAYFTDGIRLTWGPDGYDVGLDNIVFDVRAVSDPGAGIPEPGAWALMIMGFAGAGAMLRRRRVAAA